MAGKESITIYHNPRCGKSRAALANNPILIERPIVIRGNRAVIGRPPQNVIEIL